MADFTISLKAARINAEMSQDEAARNIGVSGSALASWEQGRHVPSYENVVLLAKIYNCPVGFIRLSNSSQ